MSKINKLNFGLWLIIAQLSGMGSTALAQITPDTTLPNNSAVTRTGELITIDEGTVNGSSLFHSFSEFNIRTGETAFFNNGMTIDNIITRVTGGELSTIDGLIQANDTANLFLLNPSGIQFGPNASLNIGGSFVGSTAESFLFEDGSIYSATNPTAPPLLTVNVPRGLQYGSSPNPIQVERAKLQVKTGQTLTLGGGDLTIAGGQLQAPNGGISLASTLAGTLTLDENLVITEASNDGITNFGNIELTQGAIVDSSGSINLQGNDISLQDGSQIRATTLGSVSGEDISVKAKTLSIEDGASISSTTIGEGKGGRH